MKGVLTRIALTLIGLNAALAISVVTFGDMGDTGGRILLTSLLATAAAILALAQVPAMQAARLGPAPALGMAAATVGFAVTTIGIWTETGVRAWWRFGASGYTVAIGVTIAAILSGFPVTGTSRWVNRTARGLLGAGTAMVLGGIWFEVDSDPYWRLFAVIAVLIAAVGLAIPILHRSSPPDRRITHCPFCGSHIEGATGIGITCPECTTRFRVTVAG